MPLTSIFASGHMRTFWFSFFVVSLLSFMTGQPIFVKNTLKEIDACEGKIKLTLVRTWGDDEIDDENQFFKFPQDIKVGGDGLIYIADSINNRIQVFDARGNFKKSIGKRGQGPGDLLEPLSIALDKYNNLLVCDTGNLRVESFDPSGCYVNSFRFESKKPTGIAVNQKNEILLYSFEKSFTSNSLVYVLSSQGKTLRTIGANPDKAKSIFANESIFFALDTQDNIYISFYSTPYYHKYSTDGESLLMVTYEIPYKKSTVHVEPPGKSGSLPIISGKKEFNTSSGLALDNENRVYLIAADRALADNEKFYLGSGGRRYPPKIQSENTDRYRLLVFNPGGKVIAAKKLSVFCDRIYIHQDSLFIIDTYMAMKIYQYTISFSR